MAGEGGETPQPTGEQPPNPAEAAKQVVNTPPEQLLKSSQWRRDSGQDATEASLNQGLPQSTVKETGVSTPNSTNQSPTK